MPDRFESISVGDRAEVRHVIRARDLDTFAGLTGDDNPLHMDDEFAASTPLKQRVVHGMLTASFISTIIGTKLPGEGSLWFEQSLRFLSPARIGEEIVVTAEVLSKSESQRVISIRTRVHGEAGRELVDGEAKVKVVESSSEPEPAKSDEPEAGVVLITGGARGIGASIARRLASEGYRVAVNYRSSEEAAFGLLESIEQHGGQAMAIRADITDADQVAEMFDEIRRRLGSAPLRLINNASPAIDPTPIKDLSWNGIQKQIDVQVRGAYLATRAALPSMIEAKQGCIVNLSSIVADGVPTPGWSAYTLAKAALGSLTKSLAVELGPAGIRVNAIAPGMTMTDLVADLPERAKQVAKMQTPTRRLAMPDDIAGVVSFLLSDAAAHVTGQTIRVAGGAVMA